MRTDAGGAVRAEGNVRACFDGHVLHSDILEYDRRAELLRVPNDFSLQSADGQYEVDGNGLRYDLRAQTGEVQNARVAVNDELRASGETLHLQDGRFRVERVEMTSCKGETPDWALYADSIAQEEKDLLVVRDVVLRVADLPVMYFPVYYARTGNRQKQSGFLVPEFKYNSDEGGNFRQPYYLFLADNYDATFTPEWYREHGFLFNGEFRYLTAAHRGRIDVGWAPGGESRGRQQWTHEWQIAGGRIEIDAEDVSDDRYFGDFSDDNEVLAKRNLPRKIAVEYARGEWQFAGRFESFKTINYTGAPPHDLLPQANARWRGQKGAFFWDSDWEFSRFAANDPAQFEGDRWLWRTAISRRQDVGGVAVYPEIGFHAARYSGKRGNFLDAHGAFREINGDARFITPYFLVRGESGDRPLPAENWTYQLRAVYAYAPDRKQDNAPVFDTVLREFTTGGIYDWNRFSGGDRAADANVAAYGADFRWRNPQTHAPGLDLEIAQRYYLRRPRVVLPDEDDPPESGFANLFAALRVHLNPRWKMEGDVEWNPAAKSFERVYADLRADFGGGYLLRIGGLREDGESIVAGGALPLGKRAEFAMLTRYLLDDDEFSKSDFSLVFRGECGCWSVFLRAGNLITSESGTKTSYSVGFEFKGLGRAGNNQYRKILSDLR